MITATQSFAIYEILNRHFKNEQDGRTLVKEIEEVIENRFSQERDHLSTKADIADVRSELKDVKAEILKWMIVMFAPFYVGMIVFLVKQFM